MSPSSKATTSAVASGTFDPELVVGVVTPTGSDTQEITQRLRNGFRQYCRYDVELLRISSFFDSEAPDPNEFEDHRIERLIDAGNKLCRDNDSANAVGRLAVFQISFARSRLLRAKQAGRVFRQAYLLHSLKRPAEVALLRRIYGRQFFLVAYQRPAHEREQYLLKRNLSSTDETEKLRIVRHLMQRDAKEEEAIGQKVNDTFADADYFLGKDESADRLTRLLFGDPTCAPTLAEYAMYVAYATSARSLAPGRHVGAALVQKGSIIATGFNDVPSAEEPDVVTGIDASELYKRGLVADTLVRIKSMLSSQYQDEDLALSEAIGLLSGSEVLSVIEGQRAVHAEASAIGDAAKRGIPIAGADLYVTTYPCHLCFKAAIDAGVEHVYYIEPYPKSRATSMYPGSTHKLVPYVGLAPRLFMPVFKTRPVAQPDSEGRFDFGEVRYGRPFIARGDRRGLIAKREKETMSQELVGVTRK